MILKIFSFILVCIILQTNIFSQIRAYKLNSNGLEKTTQATSSTPLSNSIGDIVPIGDTVWVGTSRGLSRSFDRGVTWTNFYGTPEFGTEDISAVAYDRGVIVAATAHSEEINDDFVPVGSGIKLSTNNGETWYSCPQPVDTDADTIVIYGNNRIRALPVTVPQQNITYDAAIANGYVWITSWAGGTRKARIDNIVSDPNTKWERVVLPPDYLNSIKPTDTLNFTLSVSRGRLGLEENLNHMGFSVATDNENLIYIGTANGLNKSTDGGISWQKFNHQNQINPISGNFVVAAGYNVNNNSIWASTKVAEGEGEYNAISFSTDDGLTWQTAIHDESVWGIGFKGNETMAATNNGIFRSANMGVTWLKPISIVDHETSLPFRGKVFYSAASEGNDIWLGSENGLVKLEEQGRMWDGNWTIFMASQKLSSNTDTYAFPNPFSPDNESVKIKYSTGGRTQSVTIRIFDFGMNLIKTVIQNAQRGEPFNNIEGSSTDNNGVIDYWDGRDEKGSIVPNGVYFYRIDMDSGDPVYGKIMVLM